MTDVTLLLVEDDPSLQEGVRDLLEIVDFDYNVNVMTAADGVEALELLQEHEVDLIISDIMMPRMNGIELLINVRQNLNWVHVPFIFVSAKGRRQDMLEGRMTGAEMYITKPFDSFELLDMIKIQLDRYLETRAVQQREMSSLKREVMQVLNHEFRTPLTYVTAYYEMLATSFSIYQDTENVGDYLRGIRTGCERMSDLVEDMIHVMDVRSGDLFHRYRDEGKFCQDGLEKFSIIASKFTERAIKESVNITFHFPESLPVFFCLEPEFFIAAGHIIENAIKFSNYRLLKDRQGEVEVTLVVEDGRLRMTVEDNGIGFPPAIKGQLFDIFFQYNRDRYEQQGSGVGLTIAKGIIDAHLGQLALEPRGESGTIATLEIPIMPAWPLMEDIDKQGEGAATWDETSLIRPRLAQILIVEDEKSVRDGLIELLRIADTAYQFQFQVANDGVEGLECLQTFKPDLIISDVMMPRMDGFQFVERLRQSPEYIQIPVIFLSARTDRKEMMHGRRVGAEEYLTKPYDSEELLSMVTAVLNRYFQLKKSVDDDFEQLKLNILSMVRPDFLGSLSDVDHFSALLDGSSKDLHTSSELRDALRGIQAGSQRISELVEDFILLAEIQTGQASKSTEKRATPVHDLPMILDHIVRNNWSKENALKLQLLTTPHKQPVLVNTSDLERALKRLVSVSEVNCVKGEGQNIYVETTEGESALQIDIWHDGQILDEEKARVIESILSHERDWHTQDAHELVYGPRLMVAHHLIASNGGRLEFISGHRQDGSLTSDVFSIFLEWGDSNSGKVGYEHHELYGFG